MVNNILLLGILVFVSITGFLLAELAGLSFTLLNPITFLVLAGLIAAVLVVSNTPIAKGVAVAILGAALFATFFIDGFFDILGAPIFGLIFIPLTIVMGFILMDAGQG